MDSQAPKDGVEVGFRVKALRGEIAGALVSQVDRTFSLHQPSLKRTEELLELSPELQTGQQGSIDSSN